MSRAALSGVRWVRWGRWLLSALIAVAIFGGQLRDSLAAIAEGTPGGSTGSGVSSLTWSHAVAAGSNRLLLVRVVNINTSVNISSVTYGGTALTSVANVVSSASTASAVRATMWYLVAPTVGTANVVVTMSGSTRVGASSQNYTGVAQTGTFGTAATNTATNGNSISTTVAAGSGDLVVDIVATQGVAVSSPLAGGAGQNDYTSSTGGSSSDVGGGASSKAANSSTSMSWTSGASTPWAQIGVAMKPAGPAISGTVFEDINYGGGAGRSLATSGGTGIDNATVELYTSAGAYISSTTTASDGSYSFGGLSSSTSYYVRVANASVVSQRTGATASLRGVMTYRTNAASGSAVAVTDYVGGTNPALVDPGSASSGATFSTSTFVYSAGLSGTAQSVTLVTLAAAAVASVDFGFNFDTIVNTNDSGQGSLRQAMTNAVTLTGSTGLAQSGLPAGQENLIFMISNGTAASGLRSAYNYFSGGIATITPTSALPTVNHYTVIDARIQPGWTSNPIVQLNGASAGASTAGFTLGGTCTVAGFIINRYGSYGLRLSGGTNTVRGSWIGLTSAGTAASANGDFGVYVSSGSGDTIGGTGSSDGNVISGNSNSGIGVYGTNTVIQGNVIGLNAAGTAAVPNGGDGISVIQTTGATIGGSTSAARNVISGNNTGMYSDGIWLDRGSGHTIQGNTIGLNVAGSAAIANVHSGMNVMGSSNNTIGGTAAGQGNVFSGNTGAGVYVSPSVNGSVTTAATGNRISGNSIYSNGALGIDIDEDGVTANDGAKPTSSGNNGMDFPVITSASLSGTTLTVAGYVGSAAGQTTFGSAVVEFFIADTTAAGNGEGRTYLGTLTANASGNFSGTVTGVTGITGGTTRITATARDGSNNTSEFGANVVVTSTLTISGNVFDDVNYGGGAGRSKATAAGAGVSGARVELYNSSAAYVSATTTSGTGAYSFTGLGTGVYFVRVVNSSVLSTRSGSTAAVVGVMTYRTEAGAGTASAVSNEVGGVNPVKVDAAAGAGGTSLWTSCATEGGTCSFTGTRTVRYGGSNGTTNSGWTTLVLTGGTACTNGVFGDPLSGYVKSCYLLNSDYQSVSTVTANGADVTGIDFGFNFDTVVNTNDSGQGSLRGAITNANTLTGDSSLAQSGRTAAVENLVFMISNGTAAAGLRSTFNYFSSGVASIAPASALPEVTGMVIDGQTQPGWSAAPLIELNGSGAGASVIGLTGRGATTLRGLVVNRFAGNGVQFLDAGSNVIQGCYIGLNAAGTAASANGGAGLNVYNSPGNTIGGTTASAGNVISGNAGIGVNLVGTGAGMVVQGNTIGLNAAGTARVANGSIGLYVASGAATIGGTSTAARNVIAGNTYENVQIGSAASSSTFKGNYVGTNASGAATITNGSDGLWINGASSVQVGGTAAGAGNVFAGNAGRGVNIGGSGTGNAVLGNSIFGNGNIGIDLANDGLTANDGAKTAGQPNLKMDYPVFTSVSLSGTTLTVAGYVGSAASQSTFASARVEVFVSDGTNTNGQGQTYLGFVTTDASGNFSGSITGASGLTAGTSKITATATDASNNTSEFGANVTVGYGLSGFVYEDLNYGGGAGRSKAAATGDSVRSGARVELYTVSGSTATYSTATTTDALGAYSFSGLAAGNYAVRVVASSVTSSRTGYTAALLPVLTYRADASSGTATAVTDNVGGTTPAAVDGGNGAAATAFSTTTGVFSAGTTGTAQAYSLATVSAGVIANLDFGFNFNAVVNTNDSGAGSLRQAITNANTLGGDASLAQSGRTAAIENLVFMISNGTAGAGLRSTLNYFSAGAATVAPTSALPTVTSPLVLDAQTQPGWSLAPIVELNGAGAGAATGLTVNAAGSTVRGFVINRFGLEGITSTAGAGLVIQGNYVGLNAAGTAASPNANSGIWLNSSANGHVVGGTTAAQRNVVAGQTTFDGIAILGGSGHTIQGNYVGSNAAGTAAIGNGREGIYVYGGVSNSSIGGTAAAAANLVRGNGGRGIRVDSGATGIAIQGNSIYGNTGIGIDLNADGATVNDGVKTAGAANLKMDYPVFTSVSLSGTTLTVAGYVGSAASQSTFAAARVEVFVADASSSAGQGQTYLGYLTADASGNFSGSISGVSGVTAGTSKITGTATDGSGNTSEFGVNVTIGFGLSGYVFEDLNYGGGAGRSKAAATGDSVRSGARVELYTVSGSTATYSTATTTDALGAYTFGGLAAGNYAVRVVGASVSSSRTGYTAALLPVLTYRADASSGTASAVTDNVGGTTPAATDGGNGAAATAFSTTTGVFSAGTTGTAQAYSLATVSAGVIANLDFGFNFDAVVNTNDSGAGSLRQAITNANTLGGDSSLAQSGRTAAIENLVFMIPNGTAGAGLRSTLNAFSSGVATITPASGLPTVSATLVMDAQTQPGWSANPVIELSGASAGSNYGLILGAAGSTLRGFIVNRWGLSGVVLNGGTGTVQGCWLGLNAAGTAAAANTYAGLYVQSSSNTIGGLTASARNVASGNGTGSGTLNAGILISSGSGNVLQGNYIGLNAAGTAAVANLPFGVDVTGASTTIGGTAAGAGNVISGNSLDGIIMRAGADGSTIQGNVIGGNAANSAVVANGRLGIDLQANTTTVGGTATNAANVVRGNTTGGVAVVGNATGNAITANSIYGNGGVGIDLGYTQAIRVNDGAKTASQPNQYMDYPVLTSASLSGVTLTVAGYVGSAASQSTFASARVEVFVSDGATANGAGQTYLGFVTADANGNFSGTITGVSGLTTGTTKLTATATDGSNNTSEFGPNYTLGLVVTGTVFEDANYGGGAGRSLATSGGTGVSGATVELYNSSGTYVSSTTSASGGSYSFNGLAAGNYFVRVVNSSVLSQRSGSTASLLPVMTYRTTATTGTAVAVTDFVGGTSPSLADPATASSGAAFNTSTYAYSAGLSGTAQSVTAVTVSASGISGLDFGFNFDTVVNTNDSGPGSLRQVLTNADTLGGDTTLAVAGRTAGIEHVVFMISNGSAGAGLRSANTAFSGGIATIALASTLPSLSNPLVIDAQLQPGWTATPVVELNGAAAGASTNGLTLNGAGSTVRGLVINRFLQNGITTATGTGLVIEGNYIGTNSAGTAASANALNGVLIAGGSATIGGLTATTRNLISGNTQNGVSVTGGTVTVRGNYVGSNAANSGSIANGASGVLIASSNATVGGTAAGAGNVIRGNAGKGVAIASGAYTGNAILGNSIYANSSLGIDLKADGLTAANDGAKTAATANLAMDSPVFTSASMSGTTLTVAGYVGSAAGQATFATARVEVFVSDATSSAGQGQTYLGTLTTDASGNFSGTITGVAGVTNGSTKLTGTATDTSNNSSEFGANVTVGMAVSGTVFEDANYGGGAGRSLAGSSGTGVSGATLEIYDNSGVFVTSTTSGSGGVYSFVGLAAGTYHVRVVSSSVLSQRSGSTAGLLPVLTFRTTATTGTAVAVTDNVGGTNPAFADPGAASAGATFSTATYAYSSGLAGTAHAVAPVTVGSASIGAVDFGFNFDTVSNTNASGAGSLRQAITNANTLGGDASLAQSGRTAAIENVVFMIPNGTAGSGLRSTFNYFVGGVATISPTSALPTITDTLVLDAQTQPGWAGTNPIVRLSGTSAGTADGLTLDAASCTVRGLIVGGFTGAGLMVNSNASGSAVQGNWLGLASTGSSANANTRRGLEVNGVNGLIVGGTTAARRNVMAGNSMEGVLLNGTANVVVTGNYIGTNAAGTAAVANGSNGGMYLLGGATASTIGGTATGAGNVISGNALRAITIETGTHTLQGNTIGLNAAGTAALVNSGGSAIYLSGTAGAQTIGGTTAASRNVIVSSTYHGINVAAASAAGTTIQGNYIGTDAAGTTVLSSGAGGVGGVFINGAGTGIAVGGTAAGAGNLIRGYGSGVLVVSGSGSAILGNSIAGNSGLGIDLKGDGVTANDGARTTGQANLLMDSPVFTSARATGNQLVVSGYIGTAAGQSVFAGARVEVFLSDNDSTGFGEGKTYLGALTADGSGNFSGTLTMPVAALAIGSKLTGTATDTASNTSEFGANFNGLIVDLVVNDKGDATDASAGDGLCATAGGVCTLRAAIAELNAWASLATPPSIVFALPGCSTVGAAACTITPASALPSVTRTVLIDGTTQTGFSTVNYIPLVEISGASAPGGTTGLVVSASNSTVRGLTINRFPANGITLSGTGNTLVGMRIGLAASTATAAANGGAGAYISGTGSLIGGSTAADRNVIAGNTGAGITVGASTTTITGNLVGTDASATSGLGNGGSGVAVLSASLTGVAISGNTLANNGAAGVGVAAGGPAQVQILANSMSGNSGLGIDLSNDGVTANTGVSNTSLPNKGINMPVITGAGVGSGSNNVTVYGYIGTGTGQAAFAGARVEFFKAAADATGYGEGQVYLGFLTADSAGHFSGTVAYTAGALNVGDALTATATDAAGNTSEFGPNWTTTSVAALTPGAFNAFDASTAAGALTGPITSKVAGTAASFAVIALDNSGTALHPGFTGTVSLNWVDARDDSGALSGSCRASWVDKGSAGSATFSNNSRVTVALTPPASGTRSMRLKMSYTGGGSTVTACSNDAFADLPASYSWTGASDADSSTAGTARALDNTAASGGVVHRAGRPFTVRARALDATGALMTGYDGSPVLAAAGCLLPSGCTAAALTAPSTATLAGAYTNNLVSYAEVGALQLQLTDTSYADVDAADTAIGVRTLTSTLLAVGRFIPDSYSVTVSTSGQLATANAACLASGAGATFIGQGFGWATTPQVTVTALNAAGATTTRWTGSLMKLTAGSGLTEVLTASNTGGATFSASYGTVAVSDLGAGQARVTASSTDRFLLDLPSGSVQDSTTPTFAWTLGLSDASEAAVAGNPTLTATANQGSVAFNSGGVFYSGRLSLSPGYGDVRSGVRQLAQLQRYTAAGWVTMTEDQGCVTIQNQNVAVETPTGVFATLGSCVAPMTGSVTTRGGRAWLAFPGTPAGAPGRLTLRLAGPAATGNSCTAAGASAALVPLTQTWLLGGASAVGPQALATWGKPQRDALLRRETW